MPLITLGENDELKLKIPSRGDIDWAEDFKLYFANPIVKHDHSGSNGMGKQLGASSLSNNSILLFSIKSNIYFAEYLPS